MDDPGQGQSLVMSAVQVPYLAMPYQANQMMDSTAPVSSGQLTTASRAQLNQHQLSYQHIHKQQLQQLDQTLQMFWANQYQEIRATTDFKNHSLPLARIKIMKADKDVANKRRALQKNDIAGAITRSDVFDFLVDIVPGDDLKEEVNHHIIMLGIIMCKPEVDQGLLYAQQPQSYMPRQFWE